MLPRYARSVQVMANLGNAASVKVRGFSHFIYMREHIHMSIENGPQDFLLIYLAIFHLSCSIHDEHTTSMTICTCQVQ